MCSQHDFAHLGAEEEPVAPRTQPVVLITGETVQEVILPEPVHYPSLLERLRAEEPKQPEWLRRQRAAAAQGNRQVRWSNHTRIG